jgi:hypothetical protein
VNQKGKRRQDNEYQQCEYGQSEYQPETVKGSKIQISVDAHRRLPDKQEGNTENQAQDN